MPLEGYESLTLDQQANILDACHRLEAAWEDRHDPELSPYLGDAAGSERLELLYALISTDMEMAIKAGIARHFEDYRALLSPTEMQILGKHFLATVKPLPVLPGYEILHEIDECGEGIVYKVRQNCSGNVIALKMMKAGREAAADERKRFRKEAEAVKALDHPNVVRVYDYGEHEQIPYFTMEFMPEGDLAKKLEKNKPSEAEAVELLLVLARALAYVHEQKIVHRDLKPANVLLGIRGQGLGIREEERATPAPPEQTNNRDKLSAPYSLTPNPYSLIPKIADFGLAKNLMPDPRQTHRRGNLSGEIVGSIAYMAPEQALGRYRRIAAQTDIHALGAILFEMLTGQPPFHSLDEVIHKEPVFPPQLEQSVSPNVEAVCLKCLEKEPEDRYGCAGDLAEDLRRILNGKSISVETLDEWQREVRWGRRAGFDRLDVLTIGPRDIVYKAREKKLNRTVALKVLSGLYATREQEQFLREAKLLAKLQHPSIVQVQYSGENGGRPYVVMEFVEGQNLVEAFGENPVSPTTAAQLVGKIADALHFAHEQSVVHCALKPGNVFLSADGSPKVTNFGFVPRTPEWGKSAGKLVMRPLPYYLAPEVVDGRRDEIGPATDVYSLGALLYKLLTGNPPFSGESLEQVYEEYRSAKPSPPREKQPQVTVKLESVCLKALEKAPEDRYASAAEMAAELRKIETDTVEFELLPGYEILEEIGRGGLGVVFKARHLFFDELVAVKFFERLESDWLEHIRQVRRAMARIRHPNLLEFRDGDVRDGILYTVEELVDGPNLEQLLKQGPLPPIKAASLVQQVADAIHQAHRIGVIHRNLKPCVILLTKDGVPKISSFELAKLPPPSPVEVKGAMIGTPKYCAPEQWLGNRNLITPATDVHALGAILYKTLTGDEPFRAKDFDGLNRQIRSGDVVPLRTLQPNLPVELEVICTKCLQTKPRRRFPSAKAMAEALEGYCNS